jgi:hypothetical protein
MNGHEMAHELTQDLSYTIALEGTSWAPDAASLMDHFLEQLELLIASCTIAADQLRRQNVEMSSSSAPAKPIAGSSMSTGWNSPGMQTTEGPQVRLFAFWMPAAEWC